MAENEFESLQLSLEKDKLQDLLDSVDKQVAHISKIIWDLQNLAKPINPELIETNYKQLIKETLRSIHIPQGIKVSTAVKHFSTEMRIDPEMVKRVLINLVNNGIQTMPNGGRLTIKVFGKGEHLCISVQDTAIGLKRSLILSSTNSQVD